MLHRMNEYRVNVVYTVPDAEFPGAEVQFADTITTWGVSAGDAWMSIVRMNEALHYNIVTAYEPVRVF